MLAKATHKLLSIALSALLLSACGSDNVQQPSTIQSNNNHIKAQTNPVTITTPKITTNEQTLKVALDQVIFADAKLKNCVTSQAKQQNWQHTSDVTELDCSNKAIVNLGGLQQFSELKQLNLSANKISILSPLSELTQLTTLNLAANGISDIKPLAPLTRLTELQLGNGNQLSSRRNHIRDISPLAGLSQLVSLDLTQNQISDVNALQGLNHLNKIELSNNQIRNIEALFTHANAISINLSNNDNIDCAKLNELESQLIQGKLNRPKDCNFTLDIRIVDIHLKDANLSTCLLDTASSEGWITISEVIELSCEHHSISELNGIENLKSLEQLNLSGNNIIDISPLQALTNANQINLIGNNQIACSRLDAIQTMFGDSNVLLRPQQCAKLTLISDLDFIDPALEQCVRYTAELYQWQTIEEMTTIECQDIEMQEKQNNYIMDLSGIEQLHHLNSIDISRQFSPKLDCALINQWHNQLINQQNLLLDRPKHCY